MRVLIVKTSSMGDVLHNREEQLPPVGRYNAGQKLLFWVLLALVAGHAAAALYHHFFQRDATLSRMLPRGWLAAGTPSPSPGKDSP